MMYADDAVIITHGKDDISVGSKLTNALSRVQVWLRDSCLMLNTKKTVCMVFSKKSTKLDRSHVFLEGVELELVPHFKYLGVITDSNLTFKKHIKKVSSTVKFSIQNFKHIRPFISTEAAKAYLHCMILSHLEYCSIVWSCTGSTAITPLEQLYKKAIKVFDKKPQSHHHCRVLEKYNLFSFENFQIFKRICLIYRSLHGLAPPPLGEFVKRRNSQLCTRAASRGDCEAPFRKSPLCSNTWSIKGCDAWNKLPVAIRDSPTFSAFKSQAKTWLKNSQNCSH